MDNNNSELLKAISDMMDQKLKALYDDMQTIKQKTTALELTIENETNRNIQLLAENHMNLVDKLNQAIRTQDKSILYEVQVSGLKAKIERLEKEMAEIKSKIA